MRAPSSDDPAPMMDLQAHLASIREPRAGGAAADPEALRSAYLDLLKLCLCDLAGTSTVSVGAMADGTVMSRELRGDGLRLRAAGMDWPLQGLTMVGLGRLDDLQACVESVVADGVEGDLIEAGAWRGGASILMRATLDAAGDERTVWVADSFEGFPEADAPDDGSLDLRAFDFLAAPLEDVRASFARLGYEDGVRFVPGFFEQTLPPLADHRWAIVRLDADTYEPTRLALRCLYPGLSVGGHLILDDYGSFEGCRRAVEEFRERHGIAEPLEQIDFTGARWRRADDAPGPPLPVDAGYERPTPRPVARARDPHVPTAQEVELVRERDALRARLAAAEAAIGLRPWLRRRLRRSGGR
jgi:O-methyltransferase